MDICEHHRVLSALRRALVEADAVPHRSPMAGSPICTLAARPRRAVGAGMAAARVTHGRRAPVWRAARPPPGVWRPGRAAGHQRGAYHPRTRHAGESISPTPHKASATLCGALHPPYPVPKRPPAAATAAAGTLRSGASECRPAHGRSGCHSQALPCPPPHPVPSDTSAAVAGAAGAAGAANAAVTRGSSDLLCVAAGGRLSVAVAPRKCVSAAGGGKEQSPLPPPHPREVAGGCQQEAGARGGHRLCRRGSSSASQRVCLSGPPRPTGGPAPPRGQRVGTRVASPAGRRVARRCGRPPGRAGCRAARFKPPQWTGAPDAAPRQCAPAQANPRWPAGGVAPSELNGSRRRDRPHAPPATQRGAGGGGCGGGGGTDATPVGLRHGGGTALETRQTRGWRMLRADP